MALRVQYPIRVKLLVLMSALVLVATASYLALAIKVFREDKTKLVYELNASAVTRSSGPASVPTSRRDRVSHRRTV